MYAAIAILISGISLAFAIYFGMKNAKRAEKSDTQADTYQAATIITKLENIEKIVEEIKKDAKDTSAKVENHGDRLIALEQQVKVLNNEVFKKNRKDGLL